MGSTAIGEKHTQWHRKHMQVSLDDEMMAEEI